MRIGGYDTLTSIEIEKATLELLDILGEDRHIIEDKIAKVSLELTKARAAPPDEGDKNMHKVISGLLSKIQRSLKKCRIILEV